MINQKKQTPIYLSLLLVFTLSNAYGLFNQEEDNTEKRNPQVIRAISNDEMRTNYRALHNRIAAKYGLTDHIISDKPHSSAPSILTEAIEYHKKTTELATDMKKKDEELNKIVRNGRGVMDGYIEDHISGPNTKSAVIKLKDSIINFLGLSR